MKATIILTCALGLLTTSPALAETNAWQTGEGFTIRLDDIDRESKEGRAQMLGRVEHAASALCREVRPQVRFDACVERTIAKALTSAPAAITNAIQLARSERDARDMASR